MINIEVLNEKCHMSATVPTKNISSIAYRHQQSPLSAPRNCWDMEVYPSRSLQFSFGNGSISVNQTVHLISGSNSYIHWLTFECYHNNDGASQFPFRNSSLIAHLKVGIHRGLHKVQDQRNSKIKQSYWSRAKIWTQELNNRVQIWGVRKQNGAKVASLSCQISAVPTQESTPCSTNQSLSWVHCRVQK